ncbi:hypothetical protein [Streptomyces chiangmaiensis]|uniref:Lipoprotein n=2 Tax=Streptomyces chiangmaiensis TaxID=766497 RepID=A0ABU7FFH5_9ACTN|nr:hypothetical protein [Streptomyces chiangmaiensis]
MGLLFSPGLGGVSSAQTGGNPDPQRLAAQAQAGLRKATSVRLDYVDRSLTATSNKRLPTAMNIALDRRGNCAGTLTLGGHGGSVEIIKRGTEVWLKPDQTFWKAELPGERGVAASREFEDRYIHGSTSNALLSGIASTCDLEALQQAAMVKAPASLHVGLATTLDGTRVVPLTFEVNGLTSTLYVTADRLHHLYRAAQKGPDTDLSLTFTDYNKPVPVRTPLASESVDISQVPNLPAS